MAGPLDALDPGMVNLLGVLSVILALIAIVQTYRADKFARKLQKMKEYLRNQVFPFLYLMII